MAQAETVQPVQQATPVQEQQSFEREKQENRKAKLTFGQSLMEKVKKFFEEVE